MRTFIIILFGQLVSLLGSGISGFAVQIWVYQQTDSVLQYSFTGFFALLPVLLFAPFAGIAADKWSRRNLMIFSDLVAALSSLLLLILFLTGNLQIWQIYIANFIILTGNTFQVPAYTALTSQLVPKEQLSRAGGLQQIAFATSSLLSPVLGGILLTIFQLSTIFIIDGITCLIAVTTLLIVRLPNLRDSQESTSSMSDTESSSSFRIMLMDGMHYLTDRIGLMYLFVFLMGTQLLMGLVTILFTPMVLSITSPNILGWLFSVSGIGTMLGGLLVSIRGNSSYPIRDIFNFSLLYSVCLLMVGLKASVILYGVGVFIFMFSIVIVDISGKALIQRKVEPSFQGRLFALKSALDSGMVAFSYIIGGLLAESVFEPLMRTDGLLASTVGQIIGVGKGRGISLMFIIVGGLEIIAILIAYQIPRLRNIEEELQDWSSQ